MVENPNDIAAKKFKAWFEERYGILNKANAETAKYTLEAFREGWVAGVREVKKLFDDKGFPL